MLCGLEQLGYRMEGLCALIWEMCLSRIVQAQEIYPTSLEIPLTVTNICHT